MIYPEVHAAELAKREAARDDFLAGRISATELAAALDPSAELKNDLSTIAQAFDDAGM